MPEKIELMSQAMKENKDIQLLVCDFQIFYDDELPVAESRQVAVPYRKELYPNIFNVLYPGCTYCVKKELIHEAREYWNEDTAHDELLWRIALFSDSLYIYPEKLIYWRRHEESSWALEGARNKTLETRIKWISYAKMQVDSLQVFVKMHNKTTLEKEQVLIGNSKWLELRGKLFKDKSVVAAYKLLLYKKYYNRFKQYLGDIYLTFLKK